jgi:radical SAM superfamily enzyme YgiQ (UPF0313 family)
MNNCSILLIHPPKVYKNQIIDNLKYPPVGLISIAAALRNHGMKVSFYDANVETGDHFKNIDRLIVEEKVNAVGMSFTSILANGAYLLADNLKENHPHISITAGGYHPTVAPDEVVGQKSFDFAIVGEGEESYLELLLALQNGTDPKEVGGLVFVKDGEVINTGPRKLIPNIDDIPIPAYDLLKMDEYDSLAVSQSPFCTIIRSRGCPFRCNFCGVDSIFTRKYRYQSAERTVDEIRYLQENFGVKEILFKDSDFLINKKNVKQLCELIIKEKVDIRWSCNARVDMTNDDILEIMAAAGCKRITFGIEAGSQEMLDALRKDTKEEDAITTVSTANKHGIECSGNFIIGAPGETLETIEKTISLAISLDLDYASFYNLIAFPGSALFAEATKNGWFLDKDPQFCGYEEMNINATELTEDQLKMAVKRALFRFYFRPNYILKRLKKSSLKEIKNSILGGIGMLKKVLFAQSKTPTVNKKLSREYLQTN